MSEPSPVVFVCAACGATLRVPGSAAGKSMRCPKCQTVGVAPTAPPEAPEPIVAEIVEDPAFSARPSRPSRRMVERSGPRDRVAEPPDRPGIVTSVAVCHFIAAFLFVALFVIGLILHVRGAVEKLLQGPDHLALRNLDISDAIYAEADKGMPGHRALLIVDNVLCLGLAALLIVSAIGLLQMRRWGRTLSLIFSGTALARGVAGILYALLFALPTVNAVTQRFVEGDLAKEADSIRRTGTLIKTMIVILPAAGMVYPLLALLALARPSVGRRLLPPKESLYEDGRPRQRRQAAWD